MNYVFIVTVSGKIDTRSVTEENICQEEYQGYKGMFVQFFTLPFAFAVLVSVAVLSIVLG